MAFRDSFYGNPDLGAIGLRRTRPFIGHVTVAYIERKIPTPEQNRLVVALNRLNERLAGREMVFSIRKAEMRWYDDLAGFTRRPGYPTYSFVTPTNGGGPIDTRRPRAEKIQ
jgi:hypothetical protein